MSTLNVTRGPDWQRMSQNVRASAHGGWVERCARLGFTAQGVVYTIIGYLALRLALGAGGGQTTDAHGAIERVADQPFGVFLLALLTVGLAAFVTWRWVQALVDPEHEASHGKALVKRVGWFISGAIYAGLAANAVRRILGRAHPGGDSARSWTAKALSQPMGQVFVAIVGLIIIGYAVKELHSAYTTHFRDKLDLQGLTARHSSTIVQLCRFGLAARGGVFLLIGGFLGSAALHSNAREAKGLGEALATLARQPHGAVLLGVAAAGLLAYALYLFLLARYQRIGPSNQAQHQVSAYR
ncbi:DUF1206 domain-containing protein [Hyalangium versicolor]|uniref:DUF1206 domain-containing protein n=1 Tax=Hyalangium versicolor TaxID=2861190 RepID=UPI001CCFB5DC|nr:DUF1206 domain-containing protein [Hyalangium versicolor]